MLQHLFEGMGLIPITLFSFFSEAALLSSMFLFLSVGCDPQTRGLCHRSTDREADHNFFKCPYFHCNNETIFSSINTFVVLCFRLKN